MIVFSDLDILVCFVKFVSDMNLALLNCPDVVDWELVSCVLISQLSGFLT